MLSEADHNYVYAANTKDLEAAEVVAAIFQYSSKNYFVLI
jgi:hypothetical protein